MNVIVRQGDVLDEHVDVRLCSANPTLGMTGGVNGALLLRGAESIQRELKDHLSGLRRMHVEPGSVIRTGPGPLAVKHILHSVGVNMFYESSVDLVRGLLIAALREASRLGAMTVATPALATGYGPLSMSQFGEALQGALQEDYPGLRELRVVLRSPESVAEVTEILRRSPQRGRDS